MINTDIHLSVRHWKTFKTVFCSAHVHIRKIMSLRGGCFCPTQHKMCFRHNVHTLLKKISYPTCLAGFKWFAKCHLLSLLGSANHLIKTRSTNHTFNCIALFNKWLWLVFSQWDPLSPLLSLFLSLCLTSMSVSPGLLTGLYKSFRLYGFLWPRHLLFRTHRSSPVTQDHHQQRGSEKTTEAE